EEKNAQQPLLLRDGQRRDHQPDPNCCEQETEQAEVKSQETASEWNVKPENGNQNNQRSFHRANQKTRQCLAEKNLCWTHGSNKKLVKRPHLTLACDRETCRQHTHQKSQYAANARDDEPPGVEIWIEPCAIQQYGRGWYRSVLCDLCFIEGGYDGLCVTHCQASRVGVSPVQDELDVCRSSALQIGGKVRADIHRHQRGFIIDGLLQSILVMHNA